MPYSENSSHSPLNAGDITQSSVERVSNNPNNPDNSIHWPTQYDAFITKTNDQMSSVNVTETHKLTDIQAGVLYLQHRPRLNATITIVDPGTAPASTSAVISNTDYNNGVITLSALPTSPTTGEFTVSYLADPDKYYGEYLTQLQDGIHELQKWTGLPSGGSADEGIANASYALLSLGGNLAARLPYAKNISALPASTDLTIASDTGVSNTITVGNGGDDVKLKSDLVEINDAVNVEGSAVSEVTHVYGQLRVAEDSGNTLSDTGGANYTAHSTNASSYFGNEDSNDVAVFYGDIQVFGDITTNGSVVANTTTTNTDVIAANLNVQGNTVLGAGIANTTTASGPMTVQGATALNSTVTIADNVTLAAGKTVDGVDLKALSSALEYMRPGGPDWKGDSINITHYTTDVYRFQSTGTETLGVSRTASGTGAGTNTLSDDTPATLMAAAYPTNNDNVAYNSGSTYDVYADGSWYLKITSGALNGNVYRVVSGPSTVSNKWTLDRALTGGSTSGASYIVYSPYRNIPNHLTGAGTTATLNASASNPVVLTAGGTVFQITSNTNVTVGSTTGTYYIFARKDSAGSLELYSVDGEPFSSPGSVCLGHVYVSGGSITDVKPARPNQKYDSGWVEVGTGTPTVSTNIFNTDAPFDSKVTLFYGGNTATNPITHLPVHFATYADAAEGEVTGISSTFARVDISTAGWYRLVVSR